MNSVDGVRVNPNWENLLTGWQDPMVITLVVIAVVMIVYDLRWKRKRRVVKLEHPWILRIGRRKVAEFDNKDEAMEKFIDVMSHRPSP